MTRVGNWLRQAIQRTPPEMKQWIGARIPASLRKRLGDQAFNQIDRAALHRFAASHRLSAPVTRSFDGGVGVVIPCFNHARFLDTTVTSLINQSYRPFHAIFVEDHSTDDTWSRLQELTTRFPTDIQVTLLRSPRNRGQAAAINQAITQTAAAVYTILNDDDYLLHDALAATLNILQREPSIYLLGGAAYVLTGDGAPTGKDQPLTIGDVSIPLQRITPQETLAFTQPNQLNMTHSGSTFFRSAWQAVGGYYPNKSERVVVFTDRDFQLRVAALLPVALTPQTAFAYWREGASVDSGLYS